MATYAQALSEGNLTLEVVEDLESAITAIQGGQDGEDFIIEINSTQFIAFVGPSTITPDASRRQTASHCHLCKPTCNAAPCAV